MDEAEKKLLLQARAQASACSAILRFLLKRLNDAGTISADNILEDLDEAFLRAGETNRLRGEAVDLAKMTEDYYREILRK